MALVLENEIVDDITSFIDNKMDHSSVFDIIHYPIHSFFRSIDTMVNAAPLNELWHTYLFKLWKDLYFDTIICDYIAHEHKYLWEPIRNRYNINIGSQYDTDYYQANQAIIEFNTLKYDYKLSLSVFNIRYRRLKLCVLNYLNSQKRIFNSIRYKEWKTLSGVRVNNILMKYYNPYLVDNFGVIGPILFHEYYASKGSPRLFLKEQSVLNRFFFNCSYSRRYKKRYLGWIDRIVYNVKPWWG